MKKVTIIDKNYIPENFYPLNSETDYGFTDLGLSNTKKLPFWDQFHLIQ